jgi:hypothetical protein
MCGKIIATVRYFPYRLVVVFAVLLCIFPSFLTANFAMIYLFVLVTAQALPMI